MTRKLKTFRRRVGHDAWHWRRTCSNWPKVVTRLVEEVVSATRPKGEACNECKAKDRADRRKARP